MVWDMTTGSHSGSNLPLFTLRGCDHMVNAVAFSSDGRKLATRSHNSILKIWETATGRYSSSPAP